MVDSSGGSAQCRVWARELVELLYPLAARSRIVAALLLQELPVFVRLLCTLGDPLTLSLGELPKAPSTFRVITACLLPVCCVLQPIESATGTLQLIVGLVHLMHHEHARKAISGMLGAAACALTTRWVRRGQCVARHCVTRAPAMA